MRQELKEKNLTKKEKTIVEKIKEKPHPFVHGSFLNKITISYMNPILQLSKKFKIPWDLHYSLPHSDKTEIAVRTMSKHLKKNHGIISSFFKAYRTEFIVSITISFFIMFADFGETISIKYLLDEADRQIKAEGRIVDREILGFFSLIITVLNLFKYVLNHNVWIQRDSLCVRIRAATVAFMYEKMMNISVINPHSHSQGAILNYVQSDIDKFHAFMWVFNVIITSTSSLILAFAIGVLVFQYTFSLLVFFLAVLVMINYFIFLIRNKFTAKWTKLSDKRIEIIKNVLGNIKFIKLNGLENNF